MLSWTAQRFGDQVLARYEKLLSNALRDDSIVEIGRVLHDAMELERHAAFEVPPEV